MRNLSFALTTRQMRDRTKTVTRRRGTFWARVLKPRKIGLDYGPPESDADASPCPRCGAMVEEPGEFGVLRHVECGYCAHPQRDGTPEGFRCVVCGEVKP